MEKNGEKFFANKITSYIKLSLHVRPPLHLLQRLKLVQYHAISHSLTPKIPYNTESLAKKNLFLFILKKHLNKPFANLQKK